MKIILRDNLFEFIERNINKEDVLKTVTEGKRIEIIVPTKEGVSNIIPQYDLEYIKGLRERLKKQYTKEQLHMNRIWIGLHCYLNVYLAIKKDNPLGFIDYMRNMGDANLFELYNLTKDIFEEVGDL